MDRTGKWVVEEPTFQSTEAFHNGHATVKMKGEWGIIDRTGKVTLEPSFDKIRPQDEGDDTAEEEETERKTNKGWRQPLPAICYLWRNHYSLP
jgi:hypothetical protein